MVKKKENLHQDKKIIFILSSQLDILSMNQYCKENIMFGSISGQNYLEYCKEANIEPLLTAIPDEHFRHFDKTINNVPYHFSIEPWENNSIMLIGYVREFSYDTKENLIQKTQRITGCDVDENATIEELLNQLIQFYDYLLFHMPGNVFWIDKNCTMLGCSKNVLDFLGIDSLEEFVGKNYEQLSEIANWQDGLAESLKQDDLSVMKSGQPIVSKNEQPIVSSDGEVSYWVSERVPIRNVRGEITGILGVSFNITESIKVKRQLESVLKVEKGFAYNTKKNLIRKIERITGNKADSTATVEELLNQLIQFYDYLLFSMPANVYWLDKDCIMLGCNKNVLDFSRH